MKRERILLSWMSFHGDFKSENGMESLQVNPHGPTMSMHKIGKGRGYKEHIILYTNEYPSQKRQQVLESHLSQNAGIPYRFQKEVMNEKDLVNLPVIQTKVQRILASLEGYDVDILVTAGTKTMHTAWHLEHLHHLDTTRLIQVRPPAFTDDGEPELIEITFDGSGLPQAAVASEVLLSRPAQLGNQVVASALTSAYTLAEKLAKTDSVTALILGESGSGKEVLADYIVKRSPRKDKPFVTVNCAALSDELLRSDLFGHEKDAFTGANKARKGLFEEANGGTLFLDEIGDISPVMQQSLLRVLQKKEITPLGSNKTIQVDVRVIAATHRNLPEACRAGKFRWDLYYRLAVVELELPRLAEWGREDRERLLDFFLQAKQQELRKSTLLNLPREVRKVILDYDFPGNIRELENLVARLYVVADKKVKLEDLPRTMKEIKGKHLMSWDEVMRSHIELVLRSQDYNKSATARILGWKVDTLNDNCKKLNIDLKPSASEEL